jgi:hypothetical protein
MPVVILRRLLTAALLLGAASPLISASAPPAATQWVTATMRLHGEAGADGVVRWRASDVTYRTAGSSHAVEAPAPFAPALAITVQNALTWGSVYPGFVDRIQTNSVAAGDVLGVFKLTGSGIKTNPAVRDEFRCYFGFPTVAISSSPAATLPVIFSESGYTYGGVSPNPTPPGTSVDLTQYSSIANQYVDRLTGTGFTFYFFVGGKVDPTGAQAAGSYTSSISITCALTGN